METRNHKWRSALCAAVDNVWPLFLPQLFLYLLACLAPLPISWLKHAFGTLNVALVAIAGIRVYLYQIEHGAKKTAVVLAWLMGGLLFFSWCGAYLEYPADPWEHLKRMSSFHDLTFVSQSYIRFKFAYFWGWVLAPWQSPGWMRGFLDIYGGFWQLAVTCQFYRLSRALGARPHEALIHTVGWICFFGTSLFGFRYYALASTPLAFVAYFSLLKYLISGDKSANRRNLFWFVTGAALVMICNHVQELLLTTVSAGALLLHRHHKNFFQNHRRYFNWFVGLGLAVGLAVSVLSPLVASLLAKGISEKSAQWWVDVCRTLSAVGTLRLFDRRIQYLETMGVPGLFAIGVSIARFKKYPLIGFLTLFPVGLMLYPPVALLLVSSTNLSNTYRILYAFPLTYSLVQWFNDVARAWSAKQGGIPRGVITFALILVLIGIGMVNRFPVYGRFYFQIFHPPPALQMAGTETLAFDLKRRMSWPSDCSLASDEATGFAISAWNGWRVSHERREGSSVLRPNFTFAEFSGVIKNHNICAVLIPQNAEVFTDSSLGELSRHWSKKHLQYASYVDPSAKTNSERLVAEQGWKEILIQEKWRLFVKPTVALSTN